LLFGAKAAGLRTLRYVRERSRPLAKGIPVELERSGLVPVASSVTRLWSEATGGEARLEAGKVENLRIAARAVHGRRFEPGQVFGFWRHVGRPSRRAGFVLGREVREGCLVPAVGGGLCQLSNALYDAALAAGFEIVERHAHSVVVPGSLAEQGRDATVFWNYVDLRFTAPTAFAISARLTSDTLDVRLWAPAPRLARGPATSMRPMARGSCASCERTRCPSYAPNLARGQRTAFLLDRHLPELDAWVRTERRERDVLHVPIDGARWNRMRYAWSTDGFATVHQAFGPTLWRALASRRLAAQGAARQRALLAHDERLARAMASALDPEDRHLVVSQTLLPFLWSEGVLGGRTFDVLATRFPLAELHARLDAAAVQYPESPTLADFRAPQSLVRAESEALAAASRVITPHAAIADAFGGRAVHLAWSVPRHRPARRGDRVVLLGPVAGRAGVHALREALRGADVVLRVSGRDLEGGFPWGDVRVERVEGDPLDGAAVVVSPAVVEHEPRGLLAAVGRGVPVLASEACGLRGVAGVETVSTEPGSLRRAIRRAVECAKA
jgi:hypothetical protein